MDVDIELYLPGEYVPYSQQKVEIYQKLAQASDYETLNDLKLEVIDRYGSLPEPAENLFGMAEVKLLAARIGLAKFVFSNKSLRMVYSPGLLPTKKQIAALSAKLSDPIEFGATGDFTIDIDMSSENGHNWAQKFKFVLQLLA
jgi:transcription-repair coupling factor (superfamily II helicase)